MPAARPSPRPRLETLEARDTPAKVGALDPSFGTAGIGELATAGGVSARFYGVATLPDGGTVAVGQTGGFGEQDMLVVRYNQDGTIDRSFNKNTGMVTIDFAGGLDSARGVAVDPQGRIVVAGFTVRSTSPDPGYYFAVARLLPDGRPDESFGGPTGTRSYSTGGGDRAYAIAEAVGIQPTTGAIVVAGHLGDGLGGEEVAVTRIDPGTGDQIGAIRRVGRTSYGSSRALAFRPDGRVVVAAGEATPAGDTVAVVTQLSADLTTVEKTLSGFTPGAGGVRGVAVGPDGTVVVGGTTQRTGTSSNLFVLRLKADLSGLDPAFNPDGAHGVQPGTAGILELDAGGHEQGFGLALDPSGRAVLAGESMTNFPQETQALVVRATPGGAPDAGFGAAGVQKFVATWETGTTAVALTPTGRIVVAGNAVGIGNAGGFVARLIGGVEEGRRLAGGGPADAAGTVFIPDATGRYAPASLPTAAPFGGLGVAVRTATADVDGDGTPDTVMVTGPGVPVRFAVVSGKDNATVLVPPTEAFPGQTFTGGGFVAAGDLDNDGRAEWVVTPDRGGGPQVLVYGLADGGAAQRAAFFGIDDPTFRGGARPAVGDVNGDGYADIAVAAGFQGGPRAAVFDGKTVKAGQTPAKLVNDFFAFPGEDAARLRDGAFVAAGDVDGDGFADLVFGGGPGGAARVFVLSGARLAAGDVAGAYAAPVANFFVAGDDKARDGVRVAVGDADGDEKADLVIGSGDGQAARVRIYLGKDRTTSTEPAAFQDLSVFGGVPLANGVYVG